MRLPRGCDSYSKRTQLLGTCVGLLESRSQGYCASPVRSVESVCLSFGLLFLLMCVLMLPAGCTGESNSTYYPSFGAQEPRRLISEWAESWNTIQYAPLGKPKDRSQGLRETGRFRLKAELAVPDRSDNHIQLFGTYCLIALDLNSPQIPGGGRSFVYCTSEYGSEQACTINYSAPDLVGMKFHATLNRDGRATLVTPFHDILKRHVSSSRTGRTAKATKDLMNILDGKPSVAPLTDLWPVYPKGGIQVGDSWTQDIEIAGFGKATFECSSIADDRVVLSVVASSSIGPDDLGNDPLKLEVATLSGSLEASTRDPLVISAVFELSRKWRGRVMGHMIERSDDREIRFAIREL